MRCQRWRRLKRGGTTESIDPDGRPGGLQAGLDLELWLVAQTHHASDSFSSEAAEYKRHPDVEQHMFARWPSMLIGQESMHLLKVHIKHISPDTILSATN